MDEPNSKTADKLSGAELIHITDSEGLWSEATGDVGHTMWHNTWDGESVLKTDKQPENWKTKSTFIRSGSNHNAVW